MGSAGQSRCQTLVRRISSTSIAHQGDGEKADLAFTTSIQIAETVNSIMRAPSRAASRPQISYRTAEFPIRYKSCTNYFRKRNQAEKKNLDEDIAWDVCLT